MTGAVASAGSIRPSAGAEFRTAYLGRIAIALAVLLYAFVRLGYQVGVETAPAVVLFCIMDTIRYVWAARLTSILPEIVIVILEVAVIGVFCYAPSPFGIGSSIPTQVMIDSPVTVLLWCYLASNAVASRPQLIWVSGGAVAVLWLGVWVAAMSDPQVVTRQTLHLAEFKTFIALLRALNAPHYFNVSLWWKIGILATLLITVALGVGLYRIRRLARAAAKQEVRRRTLAGFFPPALVDVIFATREGTLTPQNQMLTILDCDLVGFTGKAATMTPEQVAAVLALYRALMEDAVFEQDGAVLSHVGDGSVNLFGLQDNSGTSPEKAIVCALTLLRRWEETAKPLFSGEPPPLAIGIDFGTAAVGLVGEDRSLSLLATGSAVDVAASLQQATRNWNTSLLVSETAWSRIGLLLENAIFEPCMVSGTAARRLVVWH
jgi:class 3 adenylate cyclase